MLPISDVVTIPVTAERVRSVRLRRCFNASRFLRGTSSLQVCSLKFGLVSALFVSLRHGVNFEVLLTVYLSIMLVSDQLNAPILVL